MTARRRRAWLIPSMGLALAGLVALFVTAAGLVDPTRSSGEASAARGRSPPSPGDGRLSGTDGREHAARLLLPDGGLEALGLTPSAASSVIGREVPAEIRLEQAREAVHQFAARVERLEREREGHGGRGAGDPSRLDRAIVGTRRHLQIAELAERAITAEVSGDPSAAPSR